MADRKTPQSLDSGPVELAVVIDALTQSILAETRTRLGASPLPLPAALASDRPNAPTPNPAPNLTTNPAAATASPLALGLMQSDQDRVREMVDLLRRLMFPGYFDPEPLALAAPSTPPGTPADTTVLRDSVSMLAARIAAHLLRLVEAVRPYARPYQSEQNDPIAPVSTVAPTRQPHDGPKHAPHHGPQSPHWPRQVTTAFMSRLTAVREMLSQDVLAAYEGDPAAEHTDEIIVCYPGLEAVFAQRVAHELYRLDVPIIPRIISEQAHSRTGIDIHPGATIGRSFFVDHGSGVVIGETTVIGDRVKVYQGVTLGARSFPRDKDGRVIRGAKRHPTIGNDVTIYAGAVILGVDTVIGDGCVIAGGVFVTGSVPAGHVVQQVRADLTLKPTPGSLAAGPARSSDKPSSKPDSEIDLGWLDGGAGI